LADLDLDLRTGRGKKRVLVSIGDDVGSKQTFASFISLTYKNGYGTQECDSQVPPEHWVCMVMHWTVER
jgi:hypothetical protein